MNTYREFVQSIQDGIAAARDIPRPVAPVSPPLSTTDEETTAPVLLFSPHPDDECITGVLAWRLMHEMGKRIINVPVTFGSKEERRTARAGELADACGFLGWTVHRATPRPR